MKLNQASWSALGALGALLVGCLNEPPGPYVQEVGSDTVTIAWESDGPYETWIEYGPTADYGRRIELPSRAGLHEVTLSALTPDTRYYYRIRRDGRSSPGFDFRTEPTDYESFRFAVYGDTQSGSLTHRAVAASILEADPRFVIHVGDEVQDGTDKEAWTDEFFTPARPLLARVPVFVAIGNHEQNASWFYHYHSFPAPENYYAFERGGHLFLVLDTNDELDPDSAQGTWLRSQLEAARQREYAWIWVAFHHPAYHEGWQYCGGPDGEREVREHLLPLLERYGIAAIFNGHMHGYERGYLRGVYHFTTGGGGGHLDGPCHQWSHINVRAYRHHFVVADARGATTTIRAVGLDGEVIDSFVITR